MLQKSGDTTCNVIWYYNGSDWLYIDITMVLIGWYVDITMVVIGCMLQGFVSSCESAEISSTQCDRPYYYQLVSN